MACPPPEFDWSSWATWSCLREDIAPILTFIGAGIVVYAALAQARTARRRHEEQTKADRERRITESFAKAVEQLGSEKLETRLGAIYTLERLSRESEREYWPIMETLTAYVREHAPWPRRAKLRFTLLRNFKAVERSRVLRKARVQMNQPIKKKNPSQGRKGFSPRRTFKPP